MFLKIGPICSELSLWKIRLWVENYAKFLKLQKLFLSPEVEREKDFPFSLETEIYKTNLYTVELF